MLETLVLALIISYKKGYDISCIMKEKVFYPLLACEIFYWGIQIAIFKGNYMFLPYVGIFKSVYLCTTLFIVFKYELYQYAIGGSACVLIGGWCNDLAIQANGGHMPIYPTLSLLTGYVKLEDFGVLDQLHILGDRATKMKWLTDIFDIGYSVLSIGDILIRVLPFVVVYQGIKVVSQEKEKMMNNYTKEIN